MLFVHSTVLHNCIGSWHSSCSFHGIGLFFLNFTKTFNLPKRVYLHLSFPWDFTKALFLKFSFGWLDFGMVLLNSCSPFACFWVMFWYCNTSLVLVLCSIHQAVEVSEQIKDVIVISCVWLVALTIYGCMRRTRTLIEVNFIRMLHRHGDWRFRKKNSKHFVLLPLLLLFLELPLLEDEEPGFTKALNFTNLLLSSSHSGVGASRCDFTRAFF